MTTSEHLMRRESLDWATAVEHDTMPLAKSRQRWVWRPGFSSFLIGFMAFGAFGWWAWARDPDFGFMGWIAAVVWTLPITNTVIGMYGSVLTAVRLRRNRKLPVSAAIVHNPLIVVVPTVGRHDTYPALERVVRSFCRYLPDYFPYLRVDVVVEEGCAAYDQIAALAATDHLIRVVTVPRGYRTPGGTRFKARANHYAHELRYAEGEARGDVWVLHMDDDTGVGPDTAEALARFLNAQWLAGAHARHLAQGVLSYPREHAVSKLTWLADAVRPGCDISLFAATTGRGMPRAGLHGELLLVRASVEAATGWDFGPQAIVEDAQFALLFCGRHPGGSDWFPGRSYGASPATVADFVRQRERWSWGLFRLAANRTVPLRHRLLLLHNVLIWACGPIQHLGLIVLVGALLGDTDTTPVSAVLLPIWASNMAYSIWLYWEGLKINAGASEHPRRRWWEPPCLLLLIPVFSLLEAIAVFRGLVRFLRNGESTFNVIAKPM
ncbi:glycosyltransferase family 2 protein [Candidatus Protofrankia californiensis]|uniref:glycosyltransferase family 2 protein n=1 Tax=Candidatus Protofrankia californiensis TaxID=1839754 RepID=UPI0010417BD5|nr:glycosyltransferase family 2 protein [Candidatus Protofrankia californiensis]